MSGILHDIQQFSKLSWGSNDYTIKIEKDQVNISSASNTFKFAGEVTANYTVNNFEEATFDTVVIKKWLDDVRTDLSTKIDGVDKKGDDTKALLEADLKRLEEQTELGYKELNDEIKSVQETTDDKIEELEKQIISGGQARQEIEKEIEKLRKDEDEKVKELEDEIERLTEYTETKSQELEDKLSKSSNELRKELEQEKQAVDEAMKVLDDKISTVYNEVNIKLGSMQLSIVNLNNTLVKQIKQVDDRVSEHEEKNDKEFETVNYHIEELYKLIGEMPTDVKAFIEQLNKQKEELEKQKVEIERNQKELAKYKVEKNLVDSVQTSKINELDRRVTVLEKKPVPPVPPKPPVPPRPQPEPEVEEKNRVYKAYRHLKGEINMINSIYSKPIESINYYYEDYKRWGNELKLLEVNGYKSLYEWYMSKIKYIEEMNAKGKVWYWGNGDRERRELDSIINKLNSMIDRLKKKYTWLPKHIEKMEPKGQNCCCVC